MISFVFFVSQALPCPNFLFSSFSSFPNNSTSTLLLELSDSRQSTALLLPSLTPSLVFAPPPPTLGLLLSKSECKKGIEKVERRFYPPRRLLTRCSPTALGPFFFFFSTATANGTSCNSHSMKRIIYSSICPGSCSASSASATGES